MHYIIYFDIAAIFTFLISLFLYTQRNNLPIAQNITFLLFTVFGLVTTVVDIWTAYLVDSPVTVRAYYWFVQCLSFATMHILPPYFAMYILESVNYFEDKSSKRKSITHSILGLPYVLELIMILLSPVLSKHTTVVFTIGENFEYIRGTIWFFLLYICTASYVVVAVIALFQKRKKITRFKMFSIWMFILLILGSIAIQFFFPEYLVQCYGISLGGILLCCFVQNQEDFIDGTTTLFNLNAFILFTSKIFQKKQSFSCISIAINDTQFITNTFGVNRLSLCLNQIGKFLLKNIKHAYCFYIGQGEFCIVIKNKHKNNTKQIIDIIQERFKHLWSFDNIRYKIHQTICIIECPLDATNTDDIIAITNLISDNTPYKNQIIYATNLNIELKKREVFVENTLRNSTEENRIDVLYQPIFSTQSQKIMGAEAILRLKDANNHYINSEEFMPIAEKTGILLALGNTSLHSICQTMAEIKPSAYGISSINMNLSVAQCKQENLAAQILLTCKKYHVPTNLINLEISESTASQSPETLLKNMNYLSEKGISLTLDNFGTGYSNLDYLLSLPFRSVKIDKSLIISAYSDMQSNKALSSLITMIHGMGMDVIADGIETREHVEWLTNSGCDYLQGPYFSKPLQKEEFLSLMAKVTQNTRKALKKQAQKVPNTK